MNAISVGNGQLHNINMTEVTNPLDCMHDAQAIMTGGDAMASVVRRLTPLE